MYDDYYRNCTQLRPTCTRIPEGGGPSHCFRHDRLGARRSALLLVLSLLAEMAFFHQRRELYAVAMPARFLALSAKDFRAQHGRYPDSPAEFASLADRFGVAYLDQFLEGARRVGVPVDTVSVPAPDPGKRRALLVVSGGIDRIEVLANGRVRVTEHLAPPPRLRPRWMEVASS